MGNFAAVIQFPTQIRRAKTYPSVVYIVKDSYLKKERQKVTTT